MKISKITALAVGFAVSHCVACPSSIAQLADSHAPQVKHAACEKPAPRGLKLEGKVSTQALRLIEQIESARDADAKVIAPDGYTMTRRSEPVVSRVVF